MNKWQTEVEFGWWNIIFPSARQRVKLFYGSFQISTQ